MSDEERAREKGWNDAIKILHQAMKKFHLEEAAPKKKRGRPPGSKNRPKETP